MLIFYASRSKEYGRKPCWRGPPSSVRPAPKFSHHEVRRRSRSTRAREGPPNPAERQIVFFYQEQRKAGRHSGLGLVPHIRGNVMSPASARCHSNASGIQTLCQRSHRQIFGKFSLSFEVTFRGPKDCREQREHLSRR